MNILIVDDDVLIKNWLKILLSQIKEYDISVFSASDAFDALECCKNNHLDLVITDITMPRQTGLELIKTLQNEYPHIKTAVLSAYDNYEYIRLALKLGAMDYILKSEMKLEDIISLLDKVRMFSSYNADDKSNKQALFSQLRKNNNLIKEFMNDENSIEEFFSEAQLDAVSKNIAIQLFRLTEALDEESALPVIDLCNKTIFSEHMSGSSFFLNKSLFINIFHYSTEIEEYQNEIQMKLLLLIQRNINIYFGYNINSSIHVTCNNTGMFRQQLDECIDSMNGYLYYSSNPEQLSFSHLNGDTINALNNEIKKLLDIQKQDIALQALTRFVSNAHSAKAVPKELKMALTYAVTLFFLYLDVHDSSYTSAGDYNKFFKRIYNAENVEGMDKAIADFVLYYTSSLQLVSSDISDPIKKAINYMNENYMQKVTLDSVAAHIYLNRTYLSQLFKEQVGVSFCDYLENIRISKAQALILHSKTNITEISEKVGYTSQSYFTKVFKKKMGISPVKYKKWSDQQSK